jgi:phenylpropionate dioxygenase-like ring-hydroxylating dioxygenase large terminal subunit
MTPEIRDSAESGAEILEHFEAGIESGNIPSEILTSEDIFDLEKEHIFEETWVFLAHESEIPDEGDYVVRDLLDNNLIIMRDESGEVNVFYNICRHQGNKIARTDRGNSSHFRCCYHGWTYNNSGDLVGLPFETDYGEEGLDREEFSLHSPTHDTYNGMIFVTLSDDPEPLAEFLGDYTYYLDFYTGRTPEGVEFLGPQERVVDTNWKIGVVNAISDDYHVATTHQSTVDLEITPVSGSASEFHEEGKTRVGAGPGGTCVVPNSLYGYYPEEVQEAIKEGLSEEQYEMIEQGVTPTNGAMFPNTTFLIFPGMIDEDDVVPFTYIRTLLPLGPNRTKVFSWAVVDTEASDEFKEKVKDAYVFCFGESGTLEQDDYTNWRNMTSAFGGDFQTDMLFQMGAHDEEVGDWPGPGRAVHSGFSDVNGRYYFRQYLDALQQNGEDAA